MIGKEINKHRKQPPLWRMISESFPQLRENPQMPRLSHRSPSQSGLCPGVRFPARALRPVALLTRPQSCAAGCRVLPSPRSAQALTEPRGPPELAPSFPRSPSQLPRRAACVGLRSEARRRSSPDGSALLMISCPAPPRSPFSPSWPSSLQPAQGGARQGSQPRLR